MSTLRLSLGKEYVWGRPLVGVVEEEVHRKGFRVILWPSNTILVFRWSITSFSPADSFFRFVRNLISVVKIFAPPVDCRETRTASTHTTFALSKKDHKLFFVVFVMNNKKQLWFLVFIIADKARARGEEVKRCRCCEPEAHTLHCKNLNTKLLLYL